MWCTPRLISISLFAVMLLGDSLDALAQSSWRTKGEMLLAEAARQDRRRRERPAPPAEPASEEDERSTGESGSSGETEPAASTTEESGDSTGDSEGGQADSGGPGFGAGGGTSLRRSDRMDFDERLVKGQGVRSGAVYLFKRTPRKLPELVSLRTSYRDRIIEPVLGARVAARPSEEAAPTPTKTQAATPSEAQAPHTEKAPPEATGPSKAEIAREQRRQQRLRARRRRQAAQKKAQ